MPDLYRNKYRIPSARHPAWDYGWNAAYFVTICTQDRTCFFGNVETPIYGVSKKIHGISNKTHGVPHPEPKMQLSKIGQVADGCWLEIARHFPFVKLENHVVMPNHVHGIVVMDKPDDGRDTHVETRLIASLPPPPQQQPVGGITGDHNPMLHDNLSKIIRWYKGRVSFESRKIHADFAWQSRFHDHIIRDEKSFHDISEYIVDNPLNWAGDKFYKAGPA